MEQDWFPPAQALDHETQERIYLRMAVLQARNQIPRDPRYWHPQREAAWDNSSSTTERFIPAFGVARGFASVAQSEEHIRRPMTPKESYVSARVTGSQRVTPLLSYQSIGWNRRNFEPLPRSSAMSVVANGVCALITSSSDREPRTGRAIRHQMLPSGWRRKGCVRGGCRWRRCTSSWQASRGVLSPLKSCCVIRAHCLRAESKSACAMALMKGKTVWPASAQA